MRLVSKYYSTVQYFVCEFRQNARTIFDADDSVHGRARGRAAAAFHICDMILKEAGSCRVAGSWVYNIRTRYEHIFYERRLDHLHASLSLTDFTIEISDAGHAVAPWVAHARTRPKLGQIGSGPCSNDRLVDRWMEKKVSVSTKDEAAQCRARPVSPPAPRSEHGAGETLLRRFERETRSAAAPASSRSRDLI